MAKGVVPRFELVGLISNLKRLLTTAENIPPQNPRHNNSGFLSRLKSRHKSRHNHLGFNEVRVQGINPASSIRRGNNEECSRLECLVGIPKYLSAAEEE